MVKTWELDRGKRAFHQLLLPVPHLLFRTLLSRFTTSRQERLGDSSLGKRITKRGNLINILGLQKQCPALLARNKFYLYTECLIRVLAFSLRCEWAIKDHGTVRDSKYEG